MNKEVVCSTFNVENTFGMQAARLMSEFNFMQHVWKTWLRQIHSLSKLLEAVSSHKLLNNVALMIM